MISWHNKTVRVQARLIPKFLWTTASIDVFLNDQCILRTGGQLKIIGSHAATFADGNSLHQAILSWGKARQHRFPFELQIDGVLIDSAHVSVDNWRMTYIPFFLIIASVVSFFMLIF